MRRFASLSKRIYLVALSLLALLLALPMSVGALEEGVFASIRVYEGLDPAVPTEAYRDGVEDFLEIMRQSEGFIGYYWLHTRDKVAAITLFSTAEQAAASNAAARENIAESVPDLVPNPPSIIEGQVQIGFVEMLDGMGDGDVSGLYASVRVYDGFEADDLDEFVAIVEDGFLPLMRETDGFFGYYLMNDEAGKLAAISIFDSEAASLASNENAREFVAENLTAYLPNDPSITSGHLDIAALASVKAGANLARDVMMDEQVFVSIRHYGGLDPDGQDELYRLTAEGFLPIIRESEGYIGYYWLHEGENVVAVSLFESQAQAAASAESAREYVNENLAHLVAGPPRSVEGQVDIGFVELLDGMGDGEVSSLHASVRVYDGFVAADLDEFVAIVDDGFLPIMRETAGFFGYYLMHDGAGAVAAISIFDSEAASLASNENARDFVAENLTAYLPSAPAIVSGRVGIASLADLNEGANLIDDAPVFVSIRVYDGVDSLKRDEIVRLVDPRFLSIMRESDGFVGYYLLPAGDKLAAISLFDSAEQAAASNEKARDYVAEFMAPLLPNAPTIVEGHIDVMYVNDADDMTMADGMSELYASLRIYPASDMSMLAAVSRVGESLPLAGAA